MAGGEFRFGTASIYMLQTPADRARKYQTQTRDYMATFRTAFSSFGQHSSRFGSNGKAEVRDSAPIATRHLSRLVTACRTCFGCLLFHKTKLQPDALAPHVDDVVKAHYVAAWE